MEYRIYYPQIPNMGDLLNKDMLESLFQIKVQRVSKKKVIYLPLAVLYHLHFDFVRCIQSILKDK